ncbi:hypothetical protein OAO18_05495 [Francisellaceae bacterium]|nr:hypothetical protein [Francisellaceae bacterium]
MRKIKFQKKKIAKIFIPLILSFLSTDIAFASAGEVTERVEKYTDKINDVAGGIKEYIHLEHKRHKPGEFVSVFDSISLGTDYLNLAVGIINMFMPQEDPLEKVMNKLEEMDEKLDEIIIKIDNLDSRFDDLNKALGEEFSLIHETDAKNNIVDLEENIRSFGENYSIINSNVSELLTSDKNRSNLPGLDTKIKKIVKNYNTLYKHLNSAIILQKKILNSYSASVESYLIAGQDTHEFAKENILDLIETYNNSNLQVTIALSAVLSNYIKATESFIYLAGLYPEYIQSIEVAGVDLKANIEHPNLSPIELIDINMNNFLTYYAIDMNSPQQRLMKTFSENLYSDFSTTYQYSMLEKDNKLKQINFEILTKPVRTMNHMPASGSESFLYAHPWASICYLYVSPLISDFKYNGKLGYKGQYGEGKLRILCNGQNGNRSSSNLEEYSYNLKLNNKPNTPVLFYRGSNGDGGIAAKVEPLNFSNNKEILMHDYFMKADISHSVPSFSQFTEGGNHCADLRPMINNGGELKLLQQEGVYGCNRNKLEEHEGFISYNIDEIQKKSDNDYSSGISNVKSYWQYTSPTGAIDVFMLAGRTDSRYQSDSARHRKYMDWRIECATESNICHKLAPNQLCIGRDLLSFISESDRVINLVQTAYATPCVLHKNDIEFTAVDEHIDILTPERPTLGFRNYGLDTNRYLSKLTLEDGTLKIQENVNGNFQTVWEQGMSKDYRILRLQTDGNMVLYPDLASANSGVNGCGLTPKANALIQGKHRSGVKYNQLPVPPLTLKLQSDGNVVLYDRDNIAAWDLKGNVADYVAKNWIAGNDGMRNNIAREPIRFTCP